MQFRGCWVSPRTPAARISQLCCCCWCFLPHPSSPPLSLLSIPPSSFLGLSLSPVKWHKRVRSSHFSRLSFPFLILQGSVLARTNDAEPWAPTHRTVCYSHSQILAGLLLRRGTTGECGRMVSVFPLSKSQKLFKLQRVSTTFLHMLIFPAFFKWITINFIYIVTLVSRMQIDAQNYTQLNLQNVSFCSLFGLFKLVLTKK